MALFIDGASNVKGNNTGIVLEGPCDILIEQALKFKFTAINNQEECEALIILALEMGASRMNAKIDS